MKTEAVSQPHGAVLSPTPSVAPKNFPRQFGVSPLPTSADADQSPQSQGGSLGDYQ